MTRYKFVCGKCGSTCRTNSRNLKELEDYQYRGWDWSTRTHDEIYIVHTVIGYCESCRSRVVVKQWREDLFLGRDVEQL